VGFGFFREIAPLDTPTVGAYAYHGRSLDARGGREPCHQRLCFPRGNVGLPFGNTQPANAFRQSLDSLRRQFDFQRFRNTVAGCFERW
jgi:hypothetical protein